MSASCLAKTCCSIWAASGSPSAFAFRAQNNALLSGGLRYWEAANACSALLCAWAYPEPACLDGVRLGTLVGAAARSEEHTSELQSRSDLVCRLLLEKKKHNRTRAD